MGALRAFAVTEEDEGAGAIYFAKHDIVAKKWGANEFAGGEIGYISCRRAPWADAYIDRPLPVRVMIENGWHFECYGCGMRIDEDELRERGLPVEGVIGTQWSAVFCSPRCRRKHLSRQRRIEVRKNIAIEAFKAVVRKRFPDADFCDEHDNPNWRHYASVDYARGGGWHWRDVCVAFRFPGMQIAPATYRLGDRPWVGYGSTFVGPIKPHYSCCAGDRQTFEAYAAATRSTLKQEGAT